jgi:hypothetical protein
LSKESTLPKSIYSLSNILITFSAFAFVALYFVLSYFNRPVNDDITWAVVMKNKSISEFIGYFYNSWDGRWASLGLYYIVFSLSKTAMNIHYFMFIYYCFTFVILLYSVNIILRFALAEIFNCILKQSTSIIYSVLFIAAFYYFTFSNIEVWWWFTASIDYLQSIVLFLFGIALLLAQKKNILHYIKIALCFIYVGGAFEIYVLIIGASFLTLLFYFIYKNRNGFSVFRKGKYFKGITIAFISFCISFSVSLASPGNLKRRETQNQTTVSKSEIVNSFASDLKTLAGKKYILGLSFASLWLLLGMKTKTTSPLNPLSNGTRELSSLLLKILIALAITFILSIVIVALFQFIIMPHSIIPLRAWAFTSFVGSIILCFLFLFIGYRMNIKNNIILSSLYILLPIGSLVMVSANLISQYNTTSLFAKKYDNLIYTLLEANKKNITEPLELAPLPDSGSLNYLFLNEGMTKDLKSLLDLNYSIKVVQ